MGAATTVRADWQSQSTLQDELTAAIGGPIKGLVYVCRAKCSWEFFNQGVTPSVKYTVDTTSGKDGLGDYGEFYIE